MFGSTGFRFVSSTKVHVKPLESSETANIEEKSPIGPDPGSPRAYAKKRTPLTRSMTADDLHASASSDFSGFAKQPASHSSNTSVLITRLFSIDSSDSSSSGDNENEVAHEDQSSIGAAFGHSSTRRSIGLAGNEKAKQRKIPMYAVSIVLQLPPIRQLLHTPSSQHKPPPIGSNSLDHNVQSPSSAERITDWNFARGGAWEDLSLSIDRHVEHVLMHWNCVIRTLSSMETIAREHIQELLEEYSVKPQLPVVVSKAHDIRVDAKFKRPKQSSQQTVQLPTGVLQECNAIQTEADICGKRVALGLRIRRVVAGQGRWGVWREEARWVGRWAGGREQNFFFFNLLTAFLGSHTVWLDSLGPSWYRRRHKKKTQNSSSQAAPIQHRTVIVSTDKMAARRLVFLLSGFLPSTQDLRVVEGRHPTLSFQPNAGYSSSPPSVVPVLRKKSLRRTINARPKGVSDSSARKTHERSVSFSTQDYVREEAPSNGDRSMQERTRRTSDAKSIQSASLPALSGVARNRKSSTTTTSTLMPDSALPVPHFSNGWTDSTIGTSAEPRPGSSGSLASLTLTHALRRSGSNEQSNQSTESAGRWGSMISGFWSNRRDSSTDDSDFLTSSQEGLGISGLPDDSKTPRSLGKLAEMVEEVSGDLASRTPTSRSMQKPLPPMLNTIVQSPVETDRAKFSNHPTSAQNIPQRPKPEHFPVELSIDENDGVVDVDLPMPNSCSSSYGSSTAASSFNEHSSLYGRPWAADHKSVGHDEISDIAGWIKNFHPDFALQAVRPYLALKEDVKRTMRAEPTRNPPAEGPSADNKWTDVCTTLIADTTNFSVTRLILRRKERTLPDRSAGGEEQSPDPSFPLIPDIEEEIFEEPIMDMDATLIDAVERILAQSGPSSRTHSRAPSPTPSLHRNQNNNIHPQRVPGSPALEVPRGECKKMVLGALEQVVRSVTEEVVKGEGGEAEGESTLREGVRRWLGGVVV